MGMGASELSFSFSRIGFSLLGITGSLQLSGLVFECSLAQVRDVALGLRERVFRLPARACLVQGNEEQGPEAKLIAPALQPGRNRSGHSRHDGIPTRWLTQPKRKAFWVASFSVISR